MANRREIRMLLVVGGLALLVGGVGLFLGFHSNRLTLHPSKYALAPPNGPIVYKMHSIRSDPGRVRFEWAEVPGASFYHVTVFTAGGDSLFAGPEITRSYWTITPAFASYLKPQTTYHWRLTIRMVDGTRKVSDPASFATE
jgi:hypothetical protein